MNSRAKGCRGEREFRDVLRSFGFTARRGQQFAGGGESPDVVCESLPWIHWEVKRVEAGSPYRWMKQAIDDARGHGIVPNLTPIVAHKRNGEDWLIIMRAEDFLKIIRDNDLTRCSFPGQQIRE